MDYKKGDIVLVNFNPQKRAEEIGKTRPAIIVSDSDLNQILDLVTVIALTTNLIDDALPLRVRIKQKENLREDSDAMIEQLRSISKSRIGEKLTELDDAQMRIIEEGIVLMLGLGRV